MSDTPSQTRLIRLVDWPKFYPWPTTAGLRHIVFYAKDDNHPLSAFREAIVRIGKGVLLNDRRFFEIANSHNMASYQPKPRKPAVHRASGGRWR